MSDRNPTHSQRKEFVHISESRNASNFKQDCIQVSPSLISALSELASLSGDQMATMKLSSSKLVNPGGGQKTTPFL